MTVLAAVQAAAPSLGIEIPLSVYSSAERDAIELGNVANEMAARISQSAAWRKLKVLATNTGDGTITSFSLPTDYDRFPDRQSMWSAVTKCPLAHVNDHDTWLGLTLNNASSSLNAWTLLGDYIVFLTAPDVDEDISFYYMSNLYAQSDAGVNGAAFTMDDDIFRLPERLLKLAIIWQWKANKGLPYAEDMVNFEQAFGQECLRERGPRGFAIGRTRRWAPLGYPYTIGEGGSGSTGNAFWNGLAAAWGGADVTW